jgi:hypothetical protein
MYNYIHTNLSLESLYVYKNSIKISWVVLNIKACTETVSGRRRSVKLTLMQHYSDLNVAG